MARQGSSSPDVAIIGMGLRISGGIRTPEEFWELLVQKRSSNCRVPQGRFNVDSFHGTHIGRQRHASDQGHFLQDSLKSFDAGFFSMSKSEVEAMDPQQRILLEVVWECMERSGQTNWKGTNIGCYIGSFGEDWHDMLQKAPETLSAYGFFGGSDFALSNRVSYEYDLKGPSATIRTACSASLVALNSACQSLQSGECNGAIVAGANLILGPGMSTKLTENGALSITGECKTFDCAADGYSRGEGVAAIYIKRLDDALRDNDPIRAVIRSTASNSDGKTAGMSYPSISAQERLIKRAYEMAGIINESDMADTPYIECHGTGTQAGDVAETTAISKAFGNSKLKYIGSVKPNIGHCEGVSGLLSLIKAVLAIENEIIPPNINFHNPNPRIDFEGGNMQVPIEPTTWPKRRVLRVSINSFGIGGSNAHAVVESPDPYKLCTATQEEQYDANGANTMNAENIGGFQYKALCTKSMNGVNGHSYSAQKPHGTANLGRYKQNLQRQRNIRLSHENLHWIIPVSANNPKSLTRRIESLKQYVEANPTLVSRVSATLGNHRQHLPVRSFMISSESQLSKPEVFTKARSSLRHITFVFTGQGAQWAGMGRELAQNCLSFRQDIQAMDLVLQSLKSPPSWTILDALCSPSAKDINIPVFSLTLSTAVQIALVKHLGRCNVHPTAVVGHSSGETAAAFAAGAITSREAILVAYFRGIASSQITRKGAMAAVGLGVKAVTPLLIPGVVIACHNSPQSVTLSGDEDRLSEMLRAISAKCEGTFIRKLRIDKAYHSHHVAEISHQYLDMLAPFYVERKIQVPFYASLDGKLKENIPVTYWRQNLESPVLFEDAVKSILNDHQGDTTFIEIGPHSALQGPLRQICQTHSDRPLTYIPTLTRDSNAEIAINTCIGRLFARGCDVDFSSLNEAADAGESSCILTDLPNYPWDHSKDYWRENRLSRAWREQKYPHHELLGAPCPCTTDIEPTWRNVFGIVDIPWLGDYMLGNNITFPVSGYVAMAGEAIRQITGLDGYSIRDMHLHANFLLSESQNVEVVTRLKPQLIADSGRPTWYEFSIMSVTNLGWVLHCTGQAKAGSDSHRQHRGRTKHSLTRSVVSLNWYNECQRLGYNFGPSLQTLEGITSSTTTAAAAALAHLPPQKLGCTSNYRAHPLLIDACLQLLLVASVRGVPSNIESLTIPSYIGYLTVDPPASHGQLMVDATSHATSNHGTMGEARARTEDGQRVITMHSVSAKTFHPAITSGETEKSEYSDAARLEWRPSANFVDPTSYMAKPEADGLSCLELERIACLSILLSLDALKKIPSPETGHLVKQVAWLQKQHDRMKNGAWTTTVPEAQVWAFLDSVSLKKTFNSVLGQIQATLDDEGVQVSKLIAKIAQPANVSDIFLGRTDPLQILIEDNGLTNFYNFCDRSESLDKLISLYAHSQPRLRVLEIGAGTGGTTAKILAALQSRDNGPMYSEYVFTDISTGFFHAAKARFANYSGIKYKALDISQDPTTQGFNTQHYDIVIATNVLHATRIIADTMRNVRALLRPGGRLVLQEITQSKSLQAVNFIMGLLPGWWAGAADGRPEEPFLTKDRWNTELRAAGFSGTDAHVLDRQPPCQLHAFIVSTAIETNVVKVADVTILYNHKQHPFALKLASELQAEGLNVRWSQLWQADWQHQYQDTQAVISTIDLEYPLLDGISGKELQNLLLCFQTTQNRMLWLTRPTQLRCQDPSYGLSLGLIRTIRAQLGKYISTVEISDCNFSVVRALSSIFLQMHRGQSIGIEPEMAVDGGGIVWVPRYSRISATRELQVKNDSRDTAHLALKTSGQVESLYWARRPMADAAPADDEVEVEVCAVGLNYKDTLVAARNIGSDKEGMGLGASGTITQVGRRVTHLKIGDRVIFLARGAFCTRKVLPAFCALQVPETVQLEEAASIPFAFCTAILGAIGHGKLKKNQSVLINSDCRDIGLAAIQVCHKVGAVIYATVESEKKALYLMDLWGIPRQRLLRHTDDSFIDDAMQASNGHGFDLVLNTLSGGMRRAAWQCVAHYGKLIELGAPSHLAGEQSCLNLCDSNRSYHCVDLYSMCTDRPFVIQKLLGQCMRYREALPLTVFQPDNVIEAYQSMQNPEHIGMLVVNTTYQKLANTVTTIPIKRTPKLQSEGTYLLVGSMTRLTRLTASWIVEHGAKSLLFLNATAGMSQEDQQFAVELRSQGCTVSLVRGDATIREDVEKAINAAPTTITGVFQFSVAPKSSKVINIGDQDWNGQFHTVTKTTWNLHRTLRHKQLDLFLLAHSVSDQITGHMQFSDAMTSSFFQAFTQYRHGLGLVCSVINLVALTKERNFSNCLELSINDSQPVALEPNTADMHSPAGQLTIGLLSPGAVGPVAWENDVRMSLLKSSKTTPNQPSTGSSDNKFRDVVAAASSNPSVLQDASAIQLIIQKIGQVICGFLLLEEPEEHISTSLTDLGMDSLVRIEFRAWWRKSFGVDITLQDIRKADSIAVLGEMAVSCLRNKYLSVK